MLPVVSISALPAALALEKKTIGNSLAWTIFYVSFYATVLSLVPSLADIQNKFWDRDFV